MSEILKSEDMGGVILERQVTVQMSSEQYERLFFQPSAPRGDFAKRLGNPTLIGVLGFLIPFQPTVFSLLSFRGANPTSTIAFSGSYYYFGGIAMNLAGLAEFVLGNTFPFAVFVIYGCHWCNLAYNDDPLHNISAAFGANGAESMPYNSGQGMYNLTMCIVSAIFLVGSLRTNLPFACAFFGLVFLFAFIAASDFQRGYATSSAAAEHSVTLLKVAGGFGFITIVAGWYLTLITACAATGIPCPLPIGDLSSRLFSTNSEFKAGGNSEVHRTIT